MELCFGLVDDIGKLVDWIGSGALTCTFGWIEVDGTEGATAGTCVGGSTVVGGLGVGIKVEVGAPNGTVGSGITG